jgi:hypothetical protein
VSAAVVRLPVVAVEDLTSPSDRFACAPFHAVISARVCLARRGGGRTLRPPTPAFPSLAAIPWAGASGIIDASAYAAFLRHERAMAEADEWGFSDDYGRFIDFDGAEFGDWIDPLPRAPRAPQLQRSPKTEMANDE